MVKEQPGHTGQATNRDNDIIHDVIHGVDNIVDDVIGIRPGRLVLRIGSTISPANVIKNVTGIEKPSEYVEKLSDGIEADLKSKKAAFSLPSLPKPF